MSMTRAADMRTQAVSPAFISMGAMLRRAPPSHSDGAAANALPFGVAGSPGRYPVVTLVDLALGYCWRAVRSAGRPSWPTTRARCRRYMFAELWTEPPIFL